MPLLQPKKIKKGIKRCKPKRRNITSPLRSSTALQSSSYTTPSSFSPTTLSNPRQFHTKPILSITPPLSLNDIAISPPNALSRLSPAFTIQHFFQRSIFTTARRFKHYIHNPIKPRKRVGPTTLRPNAPDPYYISSTTQSVFSAPSGVKRKKAAALLNHVSQGPHEKLKRLLWSLSNTLFIDAALFRQAQSNQNDFVREIFESETFDPHQIKKTKPNHDEDTDPTFRFAEADIINLAPSRNNDHHNAEDEENKTPTYSEFFIDIEPPSDEIVDSTTSNNTPTLDLSDPLVQQSTRTIAINLLYRELLTDFSSLTFANDIPKIISALEHDMKTNEGDIYLAIETLLKSFQTSHQSYATLKSRVLDQYNSSDPFSPDDSSFSRPPILEDQLPLPVLEILYYVRNLIIYHPTPHEWATLVKIGLRVGLNSFASQCVQVMHNVHVSSYRNPNQIIQSRLRCGIHDLGLAPEVTATTSISDALSYKDRRRREFLLGSGVKLYDYDPSQPQAAAINSFLEIDTYCDITNLVESGGVDTKDQSKNKNNKSNPKEQPQKFIKRSSPSIFSPSIPALFSPTLYHVLQQSATQSPTFAAQCLAELYPIEYHSKLPLHLIEHVLLESMKPYLPLKSTNTKLDSLPSSWKKLYKLKSQNRSKTKSKQINENSDGGVDVNEVADSDDDADDDRNSDEDSAEVDVFGATSLRPIGLSPKPMPKEVLESIAHIIHSIHRRNQPIPQSVNLSFLIDAAAFHHDHDLSIKLFHFALTNAYSLALTSAQAIKKQNNQTQQHDEGLSVATASCRQLIHSLSDKFPDPQRIITEYVSNFDALYGDSTQESFLSSISSKSSYVAHVAASNALDLHGLKDKVPLQVASFFPVVSTNENTNIDSSSSPRTLSDAFSTAIAQTSPIPPLAHLDIGLFNSFIRSMIITQQYDLAIHTFQRLLINVHSSLNSYGIPNHPTHDLSTESLRNQFLNTLRQQFTPKTALSPSKLIQANDNPKKRSSKKVTDQTANDLAIPMSILTPNADTITIVLSVFQHQSRWKDILKVFFHVDQGSLMQFNPFTLTHSNLGDENDTDDVLSSINNTQLYSLQPFQLSQTNLEQDPFLYIANDHSRRHVLSKWFQQYQKTPMHTALLSRSSPSSSPSSETEPSELFSLQQLSNKLQLPSPNRYDSLILQTKTAPHQLCIPKSLPMLSLVTEACHHLNLPILTQSLLSLTQHTIAFERRLNVVQGIVGYLAEYLELTRYKTEQLRLTSPNPESLPGPQVFELYSQRLQHLTVDLIHQSKQSIHQATSGSMFHWTTNTLIEDTTLPHKLRTFGIESALLPPLPTASQQLSTEILDNPQLPSQLMAIYNPTAHPDFTMPKSNTTPLQQLKAAKSYISAIQTSSLSQLKLLPQSNYNPTIHDQSFPISKPIEIVQPVAIPIPLEEIQRSTLFEHQESKQLQYHTLSQKILSSYPELSSAPDTPDLITSLLEYQRTEPVLSVSLPHGISPASSFCTPSHKAIHLILKDLPSLAPRIDPNNPARLLPPDPSMPFETLYSTLTERLMRFVRGGQVHFDTAHNLGMIDSIVELNPSTSLLFELQQDLKLRNLREKHRLASKRKFSLEMSSPQKVMEILNKESRMRYPFLPDAERGLGTGLAGSETFMSPTRTPGYQHYIALISKMSPSLAAGSSNTAQKAMYNKIIPKRVLKSLASQYVRQVLHEPTEQIYSPQDLVFDMYGIISSYFSLSTSHQNLSKDSPSSFKAVQSMIQLNNTFSTNYHSAAAKFMYQQGKAFTLLEKNRLFLKDLSSHFPSTLLHRVLLYHISSRYMGVQASSAINDPSVVEKLKGADRILCQHPSLLSVSFDVDSKEVDHADLSLSSRPTLPGLSNDGGVSTVLHQSVNFKGEFPFRARKPTMILVSPTPTQDLGIPLTFHGSAGSTQVATTTNFQKISVIESEYLSDPLLAQKNRQPDAPQLPPNLPPSLRRHLLQTHAFVTNIFILRNDAYCAAIQSLTPPIPKPKSKISDQRNANTNHTNSVEIDGDDTLRSDQSVFEVDHSISANQENIDGDNEDAQNEEAQGKKSKPKVYRLMEKIYTRTSVERQRYKEEYDTLHNPHAAQNASFPANSSLLNYSELTTTRIESMLEVLSYMKVFANLFRFLVETYYQLSLSPKTILHSAGPKGQRHQDPSYYSAANPPDFSYPMLNDDYGTELNAGKNVFNPAEISKDKHFQQFLSPLLSHVKKQLHAQHSSKNTGHLPTSIADALRKGKLESMLAYPSPTKQLVMYDENNVPILSHAVFEQVLFHRRTVHLINSALLNKLLPDITTETSVFGACISQLNRNQLNLIRSHQHFLKSIIQRQQSFNKVPHISSKHISIPSAAPIVQTIAHSMQSPTQKEIQLYNPNLVIQRHFQAILTKAAGAFIPVPPSSSFFLSSPITAALNNITPNNNSNSTDSFSSLLKLTSKPLISASTLLTSAVAIERLNDRVGVISTNPEANQTRFSVVYSQFSAQFPQHYLFSGSFNQYRMVLNKHHQVTVVTQYDEHRISTPSPPSFPDLSSPTALTDWISSRYAPSQLHPATQSTKYGFVTNPTTSSLYANLRVEPPVVAYPGYALTPALEFDLATIQSRRHTSTFNLDGAIDVEDEIEAQLRNYSSSVLMTLRAPKATPVSFTSTFDFIPQSPLAQYPQERTVVDYFHSLCSNDMLWQRTTTDLEAPSGKHSNHQIIEHNAGMLSHPSIATQGVFSSFITQPAALGTKSFIMDVARINPQSSEPQYNPITRTLTLSQHDLHSTNRIGAKTWITEDFVYSTPAARESALFIPNHLGDLKLLPGITPSLQYFHTGISLALANAFNTHGASLDNHQSFGFHNLLNFFYSYHTLHVMNNPSQHHALLSALGITPDGNINFLKLPFPSDFQLATLFLTSLAHKPKPHSGLDMRTLVDSITHRIELGSQSIPDRTLVALSNNPKALSKRFPAPSLRNLIKMIKHNVIDHNNPAIIEQIPEIAEAKTFVQDLHDFSSNPIKIDELLSEVSRIDEIRFKNLKKMKKQFTKAADPAQKLLKHAPSALLSIHPPTPNLNDLTLPHSDQTNSTLHNIQSATQNFALLLSQQPNSPATALYDVSSFCLFLHGLERSLFTHFISTYKNARANNGQMRPLQSLSEFQQHLLELHRKSAESITQPLYLSLLFKTIYSNRASLGRAQTAKLFHHLTKIGILRGRYPTFQLSPSQTQIKPTSLKQCEIISPPSSLFIDLHGVDFRVQPHLVTLQFEQLYTTYCIQRLHSIHTQFQTTYPELSQELESQPLQSKSIFSVPSTLASLRSDDNIKPSLPIQPAQTTLTPQAKLKPTSLHQPQSRKTKDILSSFRAKQLLEHVQSPSTNVLDEPIPDVLPNLLSSTIGDSSLRDFLLNQPLVDISTPNSDSIPITSLLSSSSLYFLPQLSLATALQHGISIVTGKLDLDILMNQNHTLKPPSRLTIPAILSQFSKALLYPAPLVHEHNTSQSIPQAGLHFPSQATLVQCRNRKSPAEGQFLSQPGHLPPSAQILPTASLGSLDLSSNSCIPKKKEPLSTATITTATTATDTQPSDTQLSTTTATTTTTPADAQSSTQSPSAYLPSPPYVDNTSEYIDGKIFYQPSVLKTWFETRFSHDHKLFSVISLNNNDLTQITTTPPSTNHKLFVKLLNHTLSSLQDHYTHQFESPQLSPTSLPLSSSSQTPSQSQLPSTISNHNDDLALNNLSLQAFAALSQDEFINPTQETISRAQLIAHCDPAIKSALEQTSTDITLVQPQDFFITLKSHPNPRNVRQKNFDSSDYNDIMAHAEQSHNQALQQINPLHLPGFPFPSLNISDPSQQNDLWTFHTAQHLAKTSLHLPPSSTHNLSSPEFWNMFEADVDSTLQSIVKRHDIIPNFHPLHFYD